MSISPSSRKRKAWDLNPHDPKVARFSKPARRAVSGYLPYMSVDPPGIEPGFPVCRTGVFPLDHEPSVVSSPFQPATIPHLPFILGLESTLGVAHPPKAGAHGAPDISATFASGFSSSAHSGPAGESNPDLLVAGQVSSRWTSRPSFKRSVRESNPVPVPTTYVCCRNTYRPSVQVIPAGVEPALSCTSRRRLRHWTTGPCQ